MPERNQQPVFHEVLLQTFCVHEWMNEWMNEIVYCYNVKLYIKHNIDMVHIIVDKQMNKINKYRTIAKGYRIAAQRIWLLPIPEFKISRIKNNSIHLIKNYIKKETTKLRQGWKRASRKDPKGEGGRHNKITQEKTLKSISEIRLLKQKRKWSAYKGDNWVLDYFLQA